MSKLKLKTLDEVIATFSPDRQERIKQMAGDLVAFEEYFQELRNRITELEDEVGDLRMENSLNDSCISYIRAGAYKILGVNHSFVDDDYFALLTHLMAENERLKKKKEN